MRKPRNRADGPGEFCVYPIVRDKLAIIKKFEDYRTLQDAAVQAVREACRAARIRPITVYVPIEAPRLPEPPKVPILGIQPEWLWPTIATLAGDCRPRARHAYLEAIVDAALRRRKIKLIARIDTPDG